MGRGASRVFHRNRPRASRVDGLLDLARVARYDQGARNGLTRDVRGGRLPHGIPASEIGQFVQDADENRRDDTPACDLGEYFGEEQAGGPWLRWVRGTRSVWLRVRRVVDVMPVAMAGLRPMPDLLRGQRRTRVFLAAGVAGTEVFLLLDAGLLTLDSGLWTLDSR